MSNKPLFNKDFWRVLVRNIIIAVSVVFLALLLYLFFVEAKEVKTWMRITIIALPIIIIFASAIYKAHHIARKPERNIMYRFFSVGILLFIILILALGAWAIAHIFNHSVPGDSAIFKAVGVGVIVIWACIFLSYFIWAIYFYNINLGLTEEEWDTIKAAKEKKRNGDYYSEDDIKMQPPYNPFKDETFGLPPGTVRGMIAFTLLFGALAMLLVSIGMKNELSSNTVFWDQYEFFKKAFLMMIAFYFGSRSLKYLQSPNPVKPGSTNTQSSNGSQDDSTENTISTHITNYITSKAKDPMKDPEANDEEKDTTEQTFSGKERDPMA